MALFSVTVPDDQVQLISDAFQQQYNNDQPPTDDQGQPLTGEALALAQVEYARQRVIFFINQVVKAHLMWKAEQTKPEIPDDPIAMT